MRRSINIFPRSACHKIMVGNFRHWPNYRVYFQVKLQIQSVSFLVAFWKMSILQEPNTICQTTTNQVVIFFYLYLKGLSLHLNWTMATWLRYFVVLVSPSRQMSCWYLQPCMSVETQESLNNVAGTESNCVLCNHKHTSYWHLYVTLFAIITFFFQTKMLFE